MELGLRHLLDHVYAMSVEGLTREEREQYDTWLWSDPVREARILAAIGR